MILFRIKRTARLGIKSLWMHKLRSTLTALGIIFGIYPAYRAAYMDPIESLRHE